MARLPLRPQGPIGNNREVPVRIGTRHPQRSPRVPTLFRFVAILAILGGLVFGGMVALVTFVTPEPREITETVPPAKLQPK